jgi:pantoate--beta-alanine ligase
MIIFKSINKLNKEVNFKANVGFVPTMGSLHKGHISLIKSSKRICKKTLVSIFINPSQFNKSDDLRNYPRNLKKDIRILKKLKVDFLLTPKVSEIYKNKRDKKIKLNHSDKILCAKYRPGHFEGVLAVINQFLLAFEPRYIFFGEKDYQQLFLIKKLIKKKYKTKVFSCLTVRDNNKVALSSRNILISNKDINKSSFIAKLLLKFKKKLKKNISLKKDLNDIIFKLNNIKSIKVEYLEIRNKNNLSKNYNKTNFKIFIAYYNKKIRLIDNY